MFKSFDMIRFRETNFKIFSSEIREFSNLCLKLCGVSLLPTELGAKNVPPDKDNDEIFLAL